jgi:hypothetical protein
MPMLFGKVAGDGAGGKKSKNAEDKHGNEDNGKRRRVVTYLPPPMTKALPPTKVLSVSESGGNGEDMRWGVENKGETEIEKVKVEDVGDEVEPAQVDVDHEQEQETAQVSHKYDPQQWISHPSVFNSYPINVMDEQEVEKLVQSSSPAPRRSSPTLIDSSSPSDSDIRLSVKLDDIISRYPSTRLFMSEVQSLFQTLP